MPNHKADANLFTTIGQVMSKIYMNIQYANVNPSKTHVYTYIYICLYVIIYGYIYTHIWIQYILYMQYMRDLERILSS